MSANTTQTIRRILASLSLGYRASSQATSIQTQLSSTCDNKSMATAQLIPLFCVWIYPTISSLADEEYCYNLPTLWRQDLGARHRLITRLAWGDNWLELSRSEFVAWAKSTMGCRHNWFCFRVKSWHGVKNKSWLQRRDFWVEESWRQATLLREGGTL